ncbi:NB-ARC domain-containing protein [Microseira wollei]|uniref:WD-40 repeat-containing protein n=1 Tax=Microseira wollei NIES-4236 TaxID=2530354 RepID=A0AAV3X1T3_9CYAN|nr:NB-ARC domain-containing protein [Microseira wollei]GET36707.1 WD-40 repeat-containing protein [Microseira wollei NIES-4236]
MKSQKQTRKRGVILTTQGFDKLMAAKYEAESCENCDKRYTLEALSYRTGLDPDTLMKVFSCKIRVDKQTLNRCFRAFKLQVEPNDYQHPIQNAIPPSPPYQGGNSGDRIDWRETPDISVFYGRSEELANLKHWILEERCRLVTLLGMGGMGKTCLSVKLAEQIQEQFDFAIWRSLGNAPPVEDMLAELLQFLAADTKINLPETIEGKIAILMHYLRSYRCLLVLDNFETILQEFDYGVGYYRQGYEGYGQLLRQVGETIHQSCLIITSREKPKDIGLLEGETSPVRVWQLKGLQVTDVLEIFGESTDSSKLVDFYAGNPLALKIVYNTVKNLFAGSISEFINQNIAVFGEIRHLLERQFKRLSDGEKEIIKLLALNREPVSFSQLRERISPSMSPQKLLEGLESLEARSLIEKKSALFFVQPMVIAYVTEQLVEEKITSLPLKVFSGDEYQRLAVNT